MQTVTPTTLVKSLKVGDILPKRTESENIAYYKENGWDWENRVVYGTTGYSKIISIETTKAGRYKITREYEYTSKEGIKEMCTGKFSNGAVVGTNFVGYW